jgi:hypothetical protein
MLVFFIVAFPIMMGLYAIGKHGGKDALVLTGYGVALACLLLVMKIIGAGA